MIIINVSEFLFDYCGINFSQVFSDIHWRHVSCRGATVFWIRNECVIHWIRLWFQSIHQFCNQSIFHTWFSPMIQFCPAFSRLLLTFLFHLFPQHVFVVWYDFSYSHWTHCPRVMTLDRHGVYTSCSTFVCFCLILVSLTCSLTTVCVFVCLLCHSNPYLWHALKLPVQFHCLHHDPIPDPLLSVFLKKILSAVINLLLPCPSYWLFLHVV